MHSEWITVYQATGAGFGLVLSSMFYSIGGRKGKFNRRFIGSFILSATLVTLCLFRGLFSWWLFLTWPLLVVSLSVGYGAEILGIKILKRFIYTLGFLTVGVLCAWILGSWWVLIPQGGVGLWSIYMGVKNPIDAAAEEFFISMMLQLGILMHPFI